MEAISNIKGFIDFGAYLIDDECTWLLIDLTVRKLGAAMDSAPWRVTVVADDGSGTIGDWQYEDADLNFCFAKVIDQMKRDN